MNKLSPEMRAALLALDCATGWLDANTLRAHPRTLDALVKHGFAETVPVKYRITTLGKIAAN